MLALGCSGNHRTSGQWPRFTLRVPKPTESRPTLKDLVRVQPRSRLSDVCQKNTQTWVLRSGQEWDPAGGSTESTTGEKDRWTGWRKVKVGRRAGKDRIQKEGRTSFVFRVEGPPSGVPRPLLWSFVYVPLSLHNTQQNDRPSMRRIRVGFSFLASGPRALVPEPRPDVFESKRRLRRSWCKRECVLSKRDSDTLSE